MKIICISDTHNKHEKLILPEGDCIVHAGDFTEAGTKKETLNFLNWFSSTPYKYKILIAGNHDFYLQKKNHKLNEIIPSNIYYLEDTGITLDNINFWGSPFTPGDSSWAFSRDRGKPISEHWNKIPEATNILITHGPPLGILDELDDKKMIGCKNLKDKLKELNISFHIFGHVHDDYGSVKTQKIEYINASSLDASYKVVNQPISVIYR